MEINTLIDNIQKGDAQTSNNTFNSLMANKVNDALNTKRQDVAGGMYGNTTVEEPTSDTDV